MGAKQSKSSFKRKSRSHSDPAPVLVLSHGSAQSIPRLSLVEEMINQNNGASGFTLYQETTDDVAYQLQNEPIDEVIADSKADIPVQGWDLLDCSNNMEVLNNGAKVKKISEKATTDMVRAKIGHRRGIHVWQIHWPKAMRGSNAVVGLATTKVPLTCDGYTCLVSLGWDIVNKTSIYNDCIINPYPKTKPWDYEVSEDITVILDFNEGVLSFRDGDEDLGPCHSGLQVLARQDLLLYPAVSVTKKNAVVGFQYLEGNLKTTHQLSQSSRVKHQPSSERTKKPIIQLQFSDLRDDQTELSNNSKTVQRKCFRDVENHGVVLANRGLEADEYFEVRVDKVSENWFSGLRIGVVKDKSTLSSMPTCLLDSCQNNGIGKVWAWCQNTILENTSVLVRTEFNIDNIQKGDRIGLYQTNNKTLNFMLNDRKVAEVSNVPSPIIPVVDVHGRVVQVSLTDRNGQAIGTILSKLNSNEESQRDKINEHIFTERAKEIEGDISVLLADMKQRRVNNIRDVSIEITEKLYKVACHLTSAQHRVMLAEKVVKLLGVPIITSYFNFLQEQAANNSSALHCSSNLLQTVLCLANDSLLLMQALAENNFFSLIKKQLTLLKSKYAKDKKSYGPILSHCLGILGNCAKRSESRGYVHGDDFIQLLMYYLNTTNSDEDTMIFCYAFVLVLLPIDKIQQLVISVEAARKLLNFLKTAAKNSEFICSYEFSELHISMSIHGYQILMAIETLSQNTEGKKIMIENNVFVHLVTIGKQTTDAYYLELTLRAIYSLLDGDTVDIALKIPGFNEIIEILSESDSRTVQQEAERVSEKLKALKLPTPSIIQGVNGQAPHQQTQMCEFASLCCQFLRELNLPEVCLDKQYNMCYCPKCYETTSGGKEQCFPRGIPPKEYGVPIGWYRVGLKAPPKAFALDAFKTYHRAYHGTSIDSILPILLDDGMLLLPGDVAVGGKKIGEKEGHYCDGWKPKDFNTKKIFLSPSIRYVSVPTYATPKKVKVNGKMYQAQAVLQTLIKPGTYEVGRETLGLKDQIDPRFSNDEIEWSTDQRGAIIIYGLLLHLIQDGARHKKIS